MLFANRSLVAVMALLFVGLAGCQSSTTPSPTGSGNGAGTATPAANKKLTIAVIPKGTTHVFWKSVHAGARKAATELGNVEILWQGPLQEDDRDGQIQVVEGFITRKVDGICLAPLDSQALVPKVKEAQQEGIPTVIFDSGLDDPSVIVSYVATDNRKGGQLAARQLGQAMGKKGNVILLRYNVGSESTHQREEGFLETLAAEFPDIVVISKDEYSGTTPETSLQKCLELFNKHIDKVNGAFAVCEPNGNGMLQALQDTGLVGKVKFVTFDPSERLNKAMADKNVHGIVLQDPVTMGYTAVKTLVQHIRGEKVEKRISTGEYIATPENMATDPMQKLLNPIRAGE